MVSPARLFRRFVALALTLLCLVATSYARASVSHRAALPFPDRAQHAALNDPTTRQGDDLLISNPSPTRRVRARDVGKAAAGRRWVGASPYSYDVFGRRVSKTRSGGPLAAKRVEFLWDGEVLAFELDTETGPRAFVHESGGFEPVLQQQGGETYLKALERALGFNSASATSLSSTQAALAD